MTLISSIQMNFYSKIGAAVLSTLVVTSPAFAAEVCAIAKSSCGQVAASCTKTADSTTDHMPCASIMESNRRTVRLMKQLLDKGYTPFGDGTKFRK